MKMQLAKRLDNIGEYYFSQKLREIEGLNKQGKNIISLGIGSPDLPPHPDVIKVLQEESNKANVHGYQSYKGSLVLRNAIATWYKKWYHVDLNPEQQILPLLGSKEGIMHICMTYFESGVGVLIPNPGYPTYASAVKLSGANAIYYELNEQLQYEPDFEKLNAQVEEYNASGKGRVAGMFVNYPHMPTGKSATEALFQKLISFAQKNQILLIHDNPYSFILNDSPKSLLSQPGAMEVAIELNSLSKSHNMAGWRIGMLCGAAERIDEVLRFKSNMDSGMYLPLQLAAAKALTLDDDWHQSVNQVYHTRREKVFQLLELLNCKVNKEQVGLFVWATIPDNFKDGYALSDKILYEANVFITPGGIFGSAGNGYIRVSLCSTEDKIDEAIERIKSIKA